MINLYCKKRFMWVTVGKIYPCLQKDVKFGLYSIRDDRGDRVWYSDKIFDEVKNERDGKLKQLLRL